jgi:acetylornithine deacetylase
LKDHPLEVEWFGLWFEPSELEPDNPFVSTLTGIIEDTIDTTPIVAGAGGCDLRLPILHAGTPAVLFGPAGGMVHGTDEYVEFEQVITCAKILALTAAEWCGHA